MSYDAYDVVVVPFPFTDRMTSKRRPALVISDANVFNKPLGQTVLAMITSAKNSNWPLDISISDLDSAGLPSPSIIRMKLFTLDNQLIVRKAGILNQSDRLGVRKGLSKLFNLTGEIPFKEENLLLGIGDNRD